jgi:hypothetical protein
MCRWEHFLYTIGTTVVFVKLDYIPFYSLLFLTTNNMNISSVWKHFWKSSFGMASSYAVTFFIMSSQLSNRTLSAASSAWGTTRNHKEPCLEGKEPGKPGEFHAWPRNLGSDVKNGRGLWHKFRGHSAHARIIS